MSIARTLSGSRAAPARLQRLLEPFVPRPAVGQARQLVVPRRRLELGEQPLPLALEPQPLLGLEPTRTPTPKKVTARAP